MSRLNNTQYMSFPFSIRADGAAQSSRLEHVREQIEQVLFTMYGERWYRPEFGVGIKSLVFEPNAPGLWEVTKKRLLASLAEALAGEVDPKTLDVQVTGEEAELSVIISYTLATINHTERQHFLIGGHHG